MAPETINLLSSDDEEDVTIAPQSAARNEPVTHSSSSSAEDDDVEFVSATGDVPCRDYPHARHTCLVHPFGRGSDEACCEMCFCFVCDTSAKACSFWAEHCHADPKVPGWCARRNASRAMQSAAPSQTQLKDVVQVYPHQLRGKTAVQLNVAQQQMLAFVVDGETRGFSTRDFFLSMDAPLTRLSGGFISADMGVGKTGVVCAAQLELGGTTLVVVPPLATEQWLREFNKFAPTVRVVDAYGRAMDRLAARVGVDIDVVVTAYGSKLLPEMTTKFTRLVVDESHEMVHEKNGGSVLSFVRTAYSAGKVKSLWLLSGTPFQGLRDHTFRRQLQLFHAPSTKFEYPTESVSALRGIMIRIEKKTQVKHADGSTSAAVQVPELEYDTLKVELSAEERDLYDLAGCIDGWSEHSLSELSNDERIETALSSRFELRMLVLGERIDEFYKIATERIRDRFYAPDSLPIHQTRCIVQRLLHQVETLSQQCMQRNAKIDAIVREIERRASADPAYKAVVVSNNEAAAKYIQRVLDDQVGIMQRKKSRTSKAGSKVLCDFQQGRLRVVVCSTENVKIGINLQAAGHIFFVDSAVNNLEQRQACDRIARFGVQHTRLLASFVYVVGTISEDLYLYHADIRAGKSRAEALRRFASDDVHDFGPATSMARMCTEPTHSSAEFGYNRKAVTSPLFTDLDIDAAFEQLLETPHDDDEEEVEFVLRFPALPAMWQRVASVHVCITASEEGAASRTIVFDLTQEDRDRTDGAVLKTTQPLGDLSLVARTMHSVGGVTGNNKRISAQLYLLNGQWFDLYAKLVVLKASCQHCRWCGFRKLSDKRIFGTGSCNAGAIKGSNDELRDATLLECFPIVDVRGSLSTNGLARNVIPAARRYIPISDEWMAAAQEAFAIRRAHGVLPVEMKSAMLRTDEYFDKTAGYVEACVRLPPQVTVGATIRFDLAGRSYDVYVKEVVPAFDETSGWYTRTHVLTDAPSTERVYVESCDVVPSCRRLARV